MSTLSSFEFIEKLNQENEALYLASEIQVQAFFDSNPSHDELVKHFRGRCVNEYLNMIEVAERLFRLAPSIDRRMVLNLSKQIFDEANHYNMVADLIERLTGETLNITDLLDDEINGGDAKGARCLEKLENNDLLGLFTYQFIAEGRAFRVWQRMADIVNDDFIKKTYAKISHDERYHSSIGQLGLEALAVTPEAQRRVSELADEMRLELYEVNCRNTIEVPKARAIFTEAYGKRFASALYN